MKTKRVLPILRVIAGLGVITLVVRQLMIHWIPPGYVGVIYNARTGLEKKIYEPQAVFVGFFQDLYTYPTRIQNAVYTQENDEGEQKTADGIQITTSDSANTVYNLSVLYRVRKEDVFTAFKTFGPISIEDIQAQHIRRAVKEVCSVVGTQYDVFSMLGSQRTAASRQMTVELQRRLGPKGITVEHVLILQAYPEGPTANKITSQVNSNTLLAISQTDLEIAKITKQIGIVQAEAQAKSQSLTALQTQGKSLEMLQLDLAEDAVDRWAAAGGHLPAISDAGKNTIILGQDLIQSLGGGK